MFKNNIRICHISTIHSASSNRILEKQCKSLSHAGYEVYYLVQGEKSIETDGVKIMALPRPKNRFERMTKTLIKAYETALVLDAEVYHIHDPELIILGILLKIRRKRVIYDVHEDYKVALIHKKWIPPYLRTIVVECVVLAEWLSGRLFDGIVAATPMIESYFSKNKTVLVQNFPIMDESVQNSLIPYKDRFPIIIYLGGISELRGAKEMVLAVGMLPEHLGAQLYLAGKFSPTSMEYKIKELRGWEKVNFLGWLSQEKLAALLGKTRIGLVVLHPTHSYLDSYPMKLFEYMHAGIPVIASDFPLWRKIVEEVGCGLLVDPLNPEAIAEAIFWLLDHPDKAESMGKRGQDAIRYKFNWECEADKLLFMYHRILKCDRPRS